MSVQHKAKNVTQFIHISGHNVVHFPAPPTKLNPCVFALPVHTDLAATTLTTTKYVNINIKAERKSNVPQIGNKF